MLDSCTHSKYFRFFSYIHTLCKIKLLYLRGMKMMPLIMLSCSRTLAMLGAVN